MLTLLARLVGRLGVGRKLMLIYLLDLCSVFYVAGMLIDEKFIAIDFARDELAGSAYVSTVARSLLDVSRAPLEAMRSMPSVAADRTAMAVQALELAEQEHGQGMQSAELSRAYIAALQRLGRDGGEVLAPASLSEVRQHGQALLTRVVNQSKLILDPDLDSYYTMSVAVLRLPELLEVVNGLGLGLSLAESRPAAGQARYLMLDGRLGAVLTALRSDFQEAYAAGGPTLRAALMPSEKALLDAVEGFRRAAADTAAAPGPDRAVHQERLRQHQVFVFDALQLAWERSSIELDTLLRQRIDAHYRRMALHLGTALALMLGILAVVSFVAQQIARPLRRLAAVADEVRHSGDLTRRVDWRSSDEIGRLIDAFHDMLGQLDLEREQLQELAASQRAVEAQRRLLEALPMPLFVTAIPGHEVLHASVPAQQWLAGCEVDPWASHLSVAARTRFFQQLADQGQVDEFEVHWQALRTGTPAWAVLSARRIRFEGRDAVLTALAPVNHLKQMEQRLALWAKVFETSSEGICILDDRQRIVTANRALMRQTGHELSDLNGQMPVILLGDEEVARWPAIDQAVRRRGTWRGELLLRRRDGSAYPAWMLISAVRDDPGQLTHMVCTSIDITERRQAEQRIRYLAEHDSLTGLPNRMLCTERLRLALQLAERDGQRVAVLFIDLDRFKTINDTLGHHTGDGLLRSVAQRLSGAVRPGDTVSRLGGDEFVVVLPQIHEVLEVSQLVEQRLIPQVRAAHEVDSNELHVSCSVGIAMFPDDSRDIDELMRQADLAMYQAKSEGRNSARFFTSDMNARASERLRLETELRHALERGELSLHFQPRIDMASGTTARFEALLRWRSAELGEQLPDRFIPVAEETGLIVPIGAWVIEEACRQLALWRAAGHTALGISVNLSALQLRDAELLGTIASSLRRHQLGPGSLELEVTESVLMEQVEPHLRLLTALRELGVRLSIDDFGTGYSSLNYLSQFPIDELKIDRSFVRGRMLEGGRDLAIVRAIIGLARSLGLKVVAEGVETAGEAATLRTAGCDELQGFHYARPMPADAAGQWLREARQVAGASQVAQAAG
ncbi:PAS domain S-box-containing protein/diguanylate cyclase (GGDEF)-like protein [Sphaerotilus hippei]|uniref:PAS domain S-box-containing protein/diguanylate cyclase (GGDEF)-like protein n=1 Tax=Sphaerotilus hippei TaxID=744406 RepID=A0A318H0Y0_9BURK|nr:EAL domain-containing protein [Sphaerotilus hippei]PXW96598.1 PAS domain S-box-containing protein/diguanylate cyclase (GGDEF)-like protein [Sphaerotilus hippei]